MQSQSGFTHFPHAERTPRLYQRPSTGSLIIVIQQYNPLDLNKMTSSSQPNDVRTALAGVTGLVGSNMLKTLLTHPSIHTVSAFSRRSPEVQDPNNRLKLHIDSDSQKWSSDLPRVLTPTPSIFYSALGTTRAQAGGFEAQRKIDLDLNVALAKAAKDAGVRVYVLISSAGVNSKSYMPYSKMKGELEERITEIGFDKTVFVKPGLIVGSRNDSRPPEYILQVIAKAMGRISGGSLKDFWAQDAEVIGRAAVVAGLLALEGKTLTPTQSDVVQSGPQDKVWNVTQSDVVRLGRTEWNS